MAFPTLSYKESGVCFFLLVSCAFSNLLQDQYITVKKKKNFQILDLNHRCLIKKKEIDN